MTTTLEQIFKSHEQFIDDVRDVATKAIPRTFLEDRVILNELSTIHRAVGRIIGRLQQQAGTTRTPPAAVKKPHLKIVRTPPAAQVDQGASPPIYTPPEQESAEVVPSAGPAPGSLRARVLESICQNSTRWNNGDIALYLNVAPEQVRRATRALTVSGRIARNADNRFVFVAF